MTCPQTTLAPRESVTCTGSGTVEFGPYANVGTATAQLSFGGLVSDSDPSHYTGPTLRLEKLTTTQGTVTLGNTAGDTSVAVDVGTLAAGGGTATVTFQVVVDAPLAASVTEITNQGLVTGDGFPDVLTDDPAEPGAADPTTIPVDLPSLLEIPTLDHWALLLLGLLLTAVALRRLVGG